MADFHYKKIAVCLKELKTGINGLTQEEAEKRIKKYGFNELPRKKPISGLKLFIGQFASPLIYILIIAGFISLAINELKEAAIIFSAVIFNAIIGYYQENKASQAIAKLRQLVEHKAVVLRGGQETEIFSKLLAIGDIIIIKTGSKIPADARLIKAVDLQADEAILTGESMPSDKKEGEASKNSALADRENMVYAGTVAVRGSGQAVVTAIGADTEVGKIAKLIKDTPEEKTPLQLRLNELAKQIGIVLTIVCFAIFIIGVIEQRGIYEIFLTAISLAVASIPEGMTLSVTIILILGMQEILREKALTRKLIAAETLGSVTVICSDKTGTLTQGKMGIANIVIGEDQYDCPFLKNKTSGAENPVLRSLLMCNSAIIENQQDDPKEWRIIGSSTEAALLSAAVESGLNQEQLEQDEPKIDELPFDSKKKYMITVRAKKRGGFALYEKGAPEKLLGKSVKFYNKGKICGLTSSARKSLDEKYEELTNRGLRVIGVAVKEVKKWKAGGDWSEIDKDLIFLGFVALKDPIRPEAKETMDICKKAGIRPILITGDHRLTARAIAKEAGLKVKAENILTGDELDKISDEKLKYLAKKIEIYARVSPHHKLRIVKALQDSGEVVAMVGDGINDAPALKAADIGVSLGTGTDVAKETSDIILLDNNFKTIVSAVRRGRIIFSNIRKVITFLISDSFSEIILIAGSVVFDIPLAILPAQILWINIINDSLPNIGLAYEQGSDGLMQKKPIGKNKPILNKKIKTILLFLLIRDLLIFVIYFYFFNSGYDIGYIRTVIFAISGIDSLMYIFSLRDLNRPIWKSNPFSNLYLNSAVLISFILLLASIYWKPLSNILSTVPIKEPMIWALVFSVGAFSILIIEAVKVFFNFRHKEQNI